MRFIICASRQPRQKEQPGDKDVSLNKKLAFVIGFETRFKRIKMLSSCGAGAIPNGLGHMEMGSVLSRVRAKRFLMTD